METTPFRYSNTQSTSFPNGSTSGSSMPQAAPSKPNPLDSYSIDELKNLQAFNERTLQQAIKDRKDMTGRYWRDLHEQQAELEFRLAKLEQLPPTPETENPDMETERPPTPQYVLSAKIRATNRPFNHGRIQMLSLGEAAAIERRAMIAQAPKNPRPHIHSGLTEEEKHRRILEFMNYQGSDDEDDDDEDDEDEDEDMDEDDEGSSKFLRDSGGPGNHGGEYINTDDLSQIIQDDDDEDDEDEDEDMDEDDEGSSKFLRDSGGPGNHGGEYINTDDLSQIIQVDYGVMTPGGRYFNHIED